jgi:hypothetical protein
MGWEPRSDEQWQEAVDIAHNVLMLDSKMWRAEQLRMITKYNESRIDIRRCLEIIQEGAALGIHPAKTEICISGGGKEQRNATHPQVRKRRTR